MNRIKPLDAKVVALIAAGEVIHQPVNVVKELVENSLDAQAKNITIVLENSGLEKIEVIDDGRGIHPEDLPLALSPHATSKLQNLDDFALLETQGFRGEALASMTQVAAVTVASRQAANEAGFMIKSNETKVKPLGMPVGTRVIVESLFANTPVRQEFLQKSTTEVRKVLELINAIALAHPQVGFTLKHGDRTLLEYQANQSFIERTQTVFGPEDFSQMIPVNYQTETTTIIGFLSQPSLWTKRPGKQYLFVNKRPIKHAKLQKYLHTLITQEQVNKYYPLYNLQLNLSPQEIDVNIHPQKAKIDFYNLDQTQNHLDLALKPLITSRPVTYSSPQEMQLYVSDKTGSYRVHKFRRGLMREYTQTSQQTAHVTGEIQQLANLYLLAPTTNGLLMVDQHALHERLLFDDLKATYLDKQAQLAQDHLAVKLVFDLPPDETLLLEESLDSLKQLGITITPFSDTSYQITQVPAILGDHDILQLVKEILYAAAHDETLEVDSQTEALLASMACRMAVKAGDYLEPSKRVELVEQLLTEQHPGTCPHGRPVAIKISLSELERLFKRR